MRFALRKLIVASVWPGGLVVLAAAAVVLRGPPPDVLRPYLRYAPPLVLAFGLFLGWRFHRSRLIFGLLLLTLAERALQTAAGGSVGRFVFDAVAIALPLDLAAVAVLPDRGLATRHGGLRLAAIAAQIAGFAWLYLRHGTTATAWLEISLFDRLPPLGADLSQAALAAYLAAGTCLLLLVRRRATALEGGFLWALVASFLALWGGPGSGLATGYLTTAALALELSILETAHFMAFRDELTGLPGRRALNEALLHAAGPYAVAMVDIDHFKKVNDRHGHDVGDQVLQMVAGKLARVTGGGRAYRYGGEEFTVLFAGKSLTDALPHLEELRETIAAAPFVVRSRRRPKHKPVRPTPRQTGRQTLQITVSIGAAERGGRGIRPPEVIKAADRALYRAKKGGRNRVRT